MGRKEYICTITLMGSFSSLSQIFLDHLDIFLEQDQSGIGIIEPPRHIGLEVIELGDEASHSAIDACQHLKDLIELLFCNVFCALLLGWRRGWGDDGNFVSL